jgi:hypothetical protein
MTGLAAVSGSLSRRRVTALLRDAPGDYDQMNAFTAGTPATFGAFYLFLYRRQRPPVPWLIFGASIKTWVFLLSVVLLAQGRLDRQSFVSVGVSNGLVDGLFWAHAIHAVKANRAIVG